MTSSRGCTWDDDAEEPTAAKPRYTLRPVTKPLPSQTNAAGVGVSHQVRVRAENEDDDGYDPYSDYHDGTARTVEFEADPWR